MKRSPLHLLVTLLVLSSVLFSSVPTFAADNSRPLAGPVSNRSSLKSDVCYQIITDRFYDGDTGNNNPAQSSGLYDSTKANWKLYWGGDWAGIQQKITYLKNMGVTAIWVSPPVDNINVAATYGGTPNAGYHGY